MFVQDASHGPPYKLLQAALTAYICIKLIPTSDKENLKIACSRQLAAAYDRYLQNPLVGISRGIIFSGSE